MLTILYFIYTALHRSKGPRVNSQMQIVLWDINFGSYVPNEGLYWRILANIGLMLELQLKAATTMANIG